jgi:hypothetical protein
MLSRLIILSCAREVALAMEKTGIAHDETLDWCGEVNRAIPTRIADIASTSQVENSLRMLFRSALDRIIDRGTDDE